MEYPSFNYFLGYALQNASAIKYDLERFSSDTIKKAPSPFPEREREYINAICAAAALTYLAQYHEWLMGQIGG